MAKPILAIITHSIRMDNHLPLKYFQEFEVKHFYFDAPYGDLKTVDLGNAIKWDSFSDLEKKLIALNPDLIQGAEPYASKIAIRICRVTKKVARKLKKPYIFPMFENRPVSARFGPFWAPILKFVLKDYAGGAAAIYYLNEGAKRNLEEAGVDPKKLKQEPYGVWGVDTSLFRPAYSKPAAITGKRYILYVGRFIEDKGITYLLAAWNSVKHQFSDVELVFIGSGEMDIDIEGSQMQKMGQMKNAELPPFFANALFTVYPSITMPKWEEQVGTVNLQSLACGRPVLTTTSGAIPEYITDEVGILVPERDAEELADGMSELIENDEKREELAKKARPYILENFDAEKNVIKIEKELLILIKE
ncbi:TPA: glycosyltransferase family 1 protein [Candidatus Berkelbacteria bacterium]|uniref:Group 2 glycosyl transferase n=1 Tax=Berkelbacteria bacterium GW2011_GWE1_39_12 TaxID=1618337 RepID=A0A0G4B2Q7_9BACT|nr:MAG: group 2 glycosyl transferase [Berkelbacteria bacterium GW2011_GWE1_39_12]HBO60757.1 glycosyltransferase family 1 protein [Candidatus Berkelbacteria bacterium]